MVMVIPFSPIGVTGAGGFIGKSLLAELTAQGLPVVVFTGRIQNSDQITRFFAENQIKTVIHLAGVFSGSAKKLFDINVGGTYTLLSRGISHGLQHILYVSSGAVYGSALQPKGSLETDEPHPDTLYGLTKLHAEEVIRMFHRINRLRYTILRFPSVYGTDNTKGAIYELTNAVSKNTPLRIYGDGTQTRQFLHIQDACRSILSALTRESSDIFNIAPAKTYSINDVVKLLSVKHSLTTTSLPSNNRLVHMKLQTEKALRVLGFHAPDRLPNYLHL